MKQLTIALLMMFCCATANAQNAETTMQDIYDKGGELVKMLEERYEQEIVRIEYDLLFGTKESIRTLSTSYRYTVLAFSDDRVEDLDITVYKRSGNSWEQIMKDTETDNSPLVQFTPTAATEYKVEIKAYKFREGESAAHYGLIISHDMP